MKKAEISDTGVLPDAELLAAILQSSADAIFSISLNRSITSWNAGAERVYGYSVAEMFGEPMTRLVPEDRLGELDSILNRIRCALIEHHETERLTRSGRRISVSLTVFPTYDRLHRISGVFFIERDITRVKHAEAALAEYKTLLETGSFGFYRSTIDGQFLDVNLALVHMLGFEDCGDLLRLEPAVLYSKPGLSEELIASCQAGKTTYIEAEWKRKDGRRIWVRLSIRLARGSLQPAVDVIADDISLDRMLCQLRRTGLLGELTEQIVHDLRNCFHVIWGHEQMLEVSSSEGEQLRWHADEIHRAVDRASELISRLVQLTREGTQSLNELVRMQIREGSYFPCGVTPSLPRE